MKSDAVFEAPVFVAGLDDVAVMGEAVKECRKISSPQKYWTYGLVTQRSQTISSDRLKVYLRIASATINRAGKGGMPGPSR